MFVYIVESRLRRWCILEKHISEIIHWNVFRYRESKVSVEVER